MDPLKNPFSPGAGSPPPALAGREVILEKAKISLARIKLGKSEKNLLLVGLRGVGKTILLNKINEIAQKEGYHSLILEATERGQFLSFFVSHLRKILFELNSNGINPKVNKAFRIFKGFLNSLRVKYKDIELSLDITPEVGVADSGNLEVDIPILLEAIAIAAQDKKVAVSLIIDELQYLSEIELSALIMAVHRTSQKQLPLVIIGAGLPQLVALTGRSKSYAERLFDFPAVGALNKSDVHKALQEPVQDAGMNFNKEALQEIMNQTKGYPYFLQEWGYQCWNLADNKIINLKNVKEATKESLKRLDEGFFRVRFDRLTPAEKKYLRILASFGSGSHRSGDIADKLGVKPQSAAPTRNHLIKKGMIYSPAHGDTEFTVPLFDEFMKRMLPEL